MNQDFATSTELLKHVFSEITGRYAMFKTWSLVHTNIYSLHVHLTLILKNPKTFYFKNRQLILLGFYILLRSI